VIEHHLLFLSFVLSYHTCCSLQHSCSTSTPLFSFSIISDPFPHTLTLFLSPLLTPTFRLAPRLLTFPRSFTLLSFFLSPSHLPYSPSPLTLPTLSFSISSITPPPSQVVISSWTTPVWPTRTSPSAPPPPSACGQPSLTKVSTDVTDRNRLFHLLTEL
jgi:hypothetical protein